MLRHARRPLPRPLPLPFAAALSFALLFGAACDGSSGGGGVSVDFFVSDAPVGDLARVVVTLERVTIRDEEEVITIEKFPAEDPDDAPTETITFDLLEIQGTDRRLIIDGLMLGAGTYQHLWLHVVEDESFVEELDGDEKPIKQPSNVLKLGPFTVEAGGPQAFVIEFPLMHAMTYNPGPDRYILKPRGVRVVRVETAATLAGVVDNALFTAGPCAEKDDPGLGNVVYLYEGHGLDIDGLGDLFDPQADDPMDGPDPAGFVPAFSAERVDPVDGSYFFSFLDPGDYTVAFACDAAADDPEQFDGIPIPDPADEWKELVLEKGENLCDFPIGGGGCAD